MSGLGLSEESRRRIPPYEDVVRLPCLLRTVVGSEHEDLNGHLGIVGHMALYDMAGWPWMAELGMGPQSRHGSATLMDLESHLRYTAEVMVGDEVAVHSRIIARDRRRVHAYWVLANLSRHCISGSNEFVSVHTDLRRRCAVDFSPDVAARLDQQIGQGAGDWEAPLSGGMGLRRPA